MPADLQVLHADVTQHLDGSYPVCILPIAGDPLENAYVLTHREVGRGEGCLERIDSKHREHSLGSIGGLLNPLRFIPWGEFGWHTPVLPSSW